MFVRARPEGRGERDGLEVKCCFGLPLKVRHRLQLVLRARSNKAVVTARGGGGVLLGHGLRIFTD